MHAPPGFKSGAEPYGSIRKKRRSPLSNVTNDLKKLRYNEYLISVSVKDYSSRFKIC